MEFPDVGKRCGNDECKQLDFLPLQCRCGKIFCSEHLNGHVQSCVQSKFLSKEELKAIENVFVCSHDSCKERSVVPLICQHCKRHFCVKHRHISECQEKTLEEIQREKERYARPVRDFNKAKAAVDEQLSSNLAEAKKKEKTKLLAARVQLMKIKSKALGQNSIPSTERVYFNIHVSPLGTVVPVFVARSWTLGRIIDAVANECKLQNNNHKAAEKKLRLFKKDNDENVSRNLTAGLDSLLSENVIVDGQDLIIKYVDE